MYTASDGRYIIWKRKIVIIAFLEAKIAYISWEGGKSDYSKKKLINKIAINSQLTMAKTIVHVCTIDFIY